MIQTRRGGSLDLLLRIENVLVSIQSNWMEKMMKRGREGRKDGRKEGRGENEEDWEEGRREKRGDENQRTGQYVVSDTRCAALSECELE